MNPAAHGFLLDPDVIFLNHGSFGSCPRVVLDEQARLRERMEREPMRLLLRDLEGLLDDARARLAAFVNAPPASLAFVPNATTGVNAVLGSFPLSAGDELLVTDHEYNACRNALDRAAAGAGAGVNVVSLPLPLTKDAVVHAVLAAVTPRTRLALLDHVTSPTAAVLPLEHIVPALEARGVAVLVDGAHAPGMIPLDVTALGASFYTGNCHKWLCAPKGAGFLAVRPDRAAGVRPVVTSHGANSPRTDRARFLLEFDWTGTGDFTAYLCVPAALDFLAALLPGGVSAVMAANHARALEGGRIVAEALGVEPTCAGDMAGSMRAVALPDDGRGPTSALALDDPLQRRLFEEHRVEVPVFPFGGRRLLRVSAQVYNERSDYEALARALRPA